MSKSRYVTFCQQLLATAVVMALAFTAASVLDLQITPGSDEAAPGRGVAGPGSAAGGGGSAAPAPVAEKPVAPRVRQVSFGEAPTQESLRGGTQGRTRQEAPSRTLPQHDGMPLVASSGTQAVSGLATVGVTWSEGDPQPEDGLAVEVRTLAHGRWSAWDALEYHDDHGPDSAEGGDRAGTDPSVVGEADSVQVRVFSAQGRAPRALKVVLIDPGEGRTEVSSPALNRPTPSLESDQGDLELSAAKTTTAPQPKIYSRAQWGADERIRESGNPAYGTIQGGFVHHTVNANNYTAAQVPALIRGIYAYHVKARGWRDIGYNFLIDRFGRIWEGRYGGITKAVQGAHTEGYNEVSFAGSAIGNFDIAQPPQAVVTAFASLMAWKLSLYGIKADSTVTMKGRRFNAISGHRDTKSTACPGRYLYAKLPEIRRLAAQIQANGSASTPKPTPKPVPVPTGPTITPKPASQLPAGLNVLGSSWPDLIVREKGTNRIRVVQTGGQLGFTTPVRAGRSWAWVDQMTAAGDLTGDGKGDLVVRARATKNTYVLSGNGAGLYPSMGAPSAAFASYRWIRGAGDFDGDGRNDLLGADAAGRLMLARGDGKGRFAPAKEIAARWGSTIVQAVADLDSDKLPDLLVKGSDGRLKVYPGQRTRVGTARTLPVSTSTANAVLAGDVTGDGRADVLVRSTSGLTQVFSGDGRGSVNPRAMGPFAALSGVTFPSAARMGPGGAVRVVGGGDGNAIVTMAGNGRTNVAAVTSTSLTLPDAGHLISAGDWNGDGHADLISRPGDSTYLWFRAGDGKGGFGPMQMMGYGFASVRQLTAVGDVTGDGRPDLVGRNKDGVMLIYAGDGGHRVKVGFRAPTRLRSFNQIGSGLWNGSDHDSLLLSAGGLNFVPYAPGKAAAALARIAPAGYFDWVVGPGDVDGDRIPDLVVRAKSNGDLYLVPGTPTGFGARRFLATGFAGYDLVG